MAKSWQQVTTSDEWADWTIDEQEQARQQYFDDVVAKKIPSEYLGEARAQFDEETRDRGVDDLVAAITGVESGGNKNALSPQGARGSMQIMPGTFKQYAQAGEDYENDEHRRNAAIRKIADDYNYYGGDLALTAAAYIGGRGAVRDDDSIRDDVKDSLGTSPAKYAQMVLSRIQKNRPQYADQPATDDAPEGMPNHVNLRALDAQMEARNAQAAPQAKAPSTERTWREVATDTGRSLTQGAIDVVGVMPGALYGAATGNYDNAWLNTARGMNEVIQEDKSAGIKARQAEMDKKLSNAEGFTQKIVAGFVEGLADPTLLADTLARSMPGMVAGGGVGRIAGAGADALGMTVLKQAAQRSGIISQGLTVASAAPRVAGATAVGTSAIVQGSSVASDAYAEAMKQPIENFRAIPEFAQLAQEHGEDEAKSILAGKAATRAGMVATAASLVAQKAIPGGDSIEKMFLPATMRDVAESVVKTGALTKGMAGGVASQTAELALQGAKVGIRESASEGAEEGFGAVAKDLELSRLGKDVNLSDSFAAAAGQGAAAGFAMGHVAGMRETYATKAESIAAEGARLREMAAQRQADITKAGTVDDAIKAAADAQDYTSQSIANQILQLEGKQGETTRITPQAELPSFTSQPQPTKLGTEATAEAGTTFDASSLRDVLLNNQTKQDLANERIMLTGVEAQDLGLTPSGPVGIIDARKAGLEAQKLGFMPTEGSIEAQRLALEREGAKAARERESRFAEAGKQWQDLGITNPADDLQAQRAGMTQTPQERTINGTQTDQALQIQPKEAPAETGIRAEATRMREIMEARRQAAQPPTDTSQAGAVVPDLPNTSAAKQTTATSDVPVVETPVKDLKLSTDVPQFKSDAGSNGVVDKLDGKYDRALAAPIQVWQRTDGSMEVVSGRHRLDLAQRSGEQTVPVQVHREADGFTAAHATLLDTELNVKDGRGKVKDYVRYFQSIPIERGEATQRGLLQTAIGRDAYTIANAGSDELVASHNASQLTDQAATQIAQAAPKNGALQAVGMRMVLDGKSTTQAVNTMAAVKLMAQERGGAETEDMFGFDDSSMRDAQAMAKIAGQEQAKASNTLAAVRGAAKRPELAAKEGVNINDQTALAGRIQSLEKQKSEWSNWATNPELVAQIRSKMEPQSKQPARTEAPAQQEQAFDLTHTTPEQVKADEAALAHVDSDATLNTLEKAKARAALRKGDIEPGDILPKAQDAAQVHAVTESASMPQSENFKRWFEGSKVVDAENKPLAMYHGTNKTTNGDAISVFDTYGSNYGLFGQGQYFTDNPDVASSYTQKGKGSDPTVYKVNLAIKNPIDMDANANTQAWQKAFPDVDFSDATAPDGKPASNEALYRAAEDHYADQRLPKYEVAEAIQDGLRAMGHDGLTHIGGGRFGKKGDETQHRVYVAFEPEQIKSATGNNGEYSKSNPDISRSATASTPTDPTLTTRQTVRDAIAESLPKQARAIDRMIQRGETGKRGGLVVIEANTTEAIAKAYSEKTGRDYDAALVQVQKSADGKVQGFHDPQSGLSFVVAPNVTAKTAAAVALHEAYHGQQREAIDTKAQALLDSADDKLHTKGTRDVLAEARQKIDSAKETGNKGEAAAYIIEAAAQRGREAGFSAVDGKFMDWVDKNIGARVGGIIRDFVSMVRAHSLRIGLPINLHVDDLVAYAKIGLERAADGKTVAGDDNIRSSFAGTKAATADTHALTTAQDRITRGDDAETVRKETGWFKGVDDKWRFEINDKDAQIGKAFGLETQDTDAINQRLLPTVLWHDKLYAAYPALRKIRVDWKRDNQVGGRFSANENTINVQGPTLKDALSILLHETQHGIQNVEGFASGGSIKEMHKLREFKTAQDAADAKERETGAYIAPQIELYKRLAGETESRNVQTRQKLTDEQRLAQSPESTADVKASDVIVIMNGKEMHATAAPPPANTPPAQQPSAPSSPSWDYEGSKADKLIYELQDGRIDLKRVQESIKKSGQDINEKFDARLAETLYAGRVATRTDRFLQDDAAPLLEQMARSKVTMPELSDYLLARHAPERNAQIAKVNDKMPDGGAGTNSQGVRMTTQAATDYIANLPTETRLKMEALAQKVDAITKGTRDMLVAEGLEKQETIDAWNAAYKNYAPLFREDVDEGRPHSVGTGFSVRGDSSKSATGSDKKVDNMLAHVLMQREAAITRAEKNRVAMSLYGLALSSPNKDFWTTITPKDKTQRIMGELVAMGVDPVVAEQGMSGIPTTRTVDKVTGKVVDRINPLYKSLPGAISVRINGEDRILLLNQKDQNALRLAESLKNLDGLTKYDLAGTMLGKTTRWISAAATQYNPAFGLVNATRDSLGAMVNLSTTPLAGKQLKVFANMPSATAGIYAALRGDLTSEDAKLFRQSQMDGGQVGFKDIFNDVNDRAKAIEKKIARYGNSKLSPGEVAHAALDVLDGFNTIAENTMRFAAYKTALEQGMSRPAAAKLSRELTLDFNRKGRMGREFGPAYAFFNAGAQGVGKLAEVISGPAGAKIIAGGIGMGVLQALILAQCGYEDDDLKDWDKARGFFVPTGKDENGEKTHFIIPLPPGLSALPNLGRTATELAMTKGKDAGRKIMASISEIIGSLNPVGGGSVFTLEKGLDWGGVLHTVAPSFADPIVDLAMNKNFKGDSIEKEYRNEADNRPGFQRAREKTRRTPTGQMYIGLTKALNRATGGDDYEAGFISPSPEKARYLAEAIGGGLLREIEKAVDLSMKVPGQKPTKVTGIPVINRFFGVTDSDAVAEKRYYNFADKAKSAESSINLAKAAGDGEAAKKIHEKRPEAKTIPLINRVQPKLAKLNKLAVSQINNDENIKLIDDARLEWMKATNKAILELEAQ